MWLLGVVAAAAGLVVGIYLFDVLSNVVRDLSRPGRQDKLSKRAEALMTERADSAGSGRSEADDAAGPRRAK